MGKISEDILIKAFRTSDLFMVVWTDASGNPCYYHRGGYITIDSLLKALDKRLTADFEQKLKDLY